LNTRSLGVLGGTATRHAPGQQQQPTLGRSTKEKRRPKDSVIEKLRLKNFTLKEQRARFKKKKWATCCTASIIDFHQLQIENKQHVDKTEERNGKSRNGLLKSEVTRGNMAHASSDRMI
jgi:hypothetical protein